ncbi:hypothetical protein [Niabella beijingensis]|uniref:hypothetical protein n=1 Tax=Niabella beijingensis TaxID=2872700 RepID=UPI001CBCB9F1|nr:hypothetical protein [Niabella beijingensis]MBZ4190118.1 hypothetical protein [Niabella beijingensis]
MYFLRKAFLLSAVLSIGILLFAQAKTPEDFGYRYIQTTFRGDPVDLLIKSKKGEEKIKKPLFLFFQGSQPQPLIKTDGAASYSVFPFHTDSLAVFYHLVIIGKPYIPVIADKKELGANMMYLDSAGNIPLNYAERNLLSYYTQRANHIIRYLQSLPFIDPRELIVAGHSEGSTISAEVAFTNKRVTHLIYSGGNPIGRIMNMIGPARFFEKDSSAQAENVFQLWEQATREPEKINYGKGDTNKSLVEFSAPLLPRLLTLKIPVLVSYGSRDWCTPFNDYFRVECIRLKKKNIVFNTYIGTEHNYFPVDREGNINYEAFNWNKVAGDWLKWLKK